tara:strand:- start:211 stop:648 length:438 start_codon:yes stop_codon:yes gene_type:complete
MKNIILCDIDGTVANNDHRQHFLEGKKDWDGFFSELSNDTPITPIINLVIDEQASGKEIVFLTGRPERYRYSTTLWLKEYFDFEFRLLMRRNNDQRNKLEIKKEIFKNNLEPEKIFCCYENDNKLIEMWINLGIKVIDVNKLLLL